MTTPAFISEFVTAQKRDRHWSDGTIYVRTMSLSFLDSHLGIRTLTADELLEFVDAYDDETYRRGVVNNLSQFYEWCIQQNTRTDNPTLPIKAKWRSERAAAKAAKSQAKTEDVQSLAQRFMAAPLSVMDAGAGLWNLRKRRWVALGLDGDDATRGRAASSNNSGPRQEMPTWAPAKSDRLQNTASIFDPSLCEIVYEWFCPRGGSVLDPFAGGLARGAVAAATGHDYVGIDLRIDQVDHNVAQWKALRDNLMIDHDPTWIVGDAMDISVIADRRAPYDLVFTCPPYYNLERYSDRREDLSAMPTYEDFRISLGVIMRDAARLLSDDRFFVMMIGDLRSEDGSYYGLVADTIATAQRMGLSLYNDIVVIQRTGSAAIYARQPFEASRKVRRVHQHLLVFVKGDPQKASSSASDHDPTWLHLPKIVAA